MLNATTVPGIAKDPDITLRTLFRIPIVILSPSSEQRLSDKSGATHNIDTADTPFSSSRVTEKYIMFLLRGL